MNLKAFEDYLQTLATSHVDMGNGNPNSMCFARLASDDEVNAIISNPNAHKRIIIMENVTGNPVGDVEEGKYQQVFTLSFLGYVDPSTGTTTAARDAEIDKMWQIMMQFRAKMLKDLNDDDCGPLRGIAYRMPYRFIQDPQLTSHYGWELTVYKTVWAPEYDAAKWV